MTTNERLLFVLFEEEEKEEKESGKLNATSFFISFVFVFVFFIKASEGKRGIGIIDSSAPIRRRGRNGDDDDDSRGGNEDEDEEDEETKRPRENNDKKEDQRDKAVNEEALILVVISLSLSLYTNRSLLVASMHFRPERFLAVFLFRVFNPNKCAFRSFLSFSLFLENIFLLCFSSDII